MDRKEIQEQSLEMISGDRHANLLQVFLWLWIALKKTGSRKSGLDWETATAPLRWMRICCG